MSDSMQLVNEAAQNIQAVGKTTEAVSNNEEKMSGALKMVPLNDSESAEIAANVARQLDALKSVDIYAEDSDLTKEIQTVFDTSQKRRADTDEITNYFLKRNFQGVESGESFKTINELRNALEEYDPRKFDLTAPERILGFIPMPGIAKRRVKEYARKFKEAETHINDIMDGVMSAKDDGVRAITELKTVEKKLLSLAKNLRKEYETFKTLSSGIESYLNELDERDPIKAAKIRNEVMLRMGQEKMDTLTTLNHAILGVTEVGVLIKTQEMVISACNRVSSTGRLILAINQTVAAATNDQAHAAEMLIKVNESINNMTSNTAKTIKDHTQVMRDLTENPISAVETLASAFDDAFAAVDDLKAHQIEASKKAEQSIQKLEQVREKAESRINAERSAAATVNTAFSVGVGSSPKP